MSITNSHVAKVRELSGAGIMDCKKALVETEGDIEAAIEYLRKTGITKAAKKAGRIAADGSIIIKSSVDKELGIIAEVNCETDFVANDGNFTGFVETVGETALENECDSVAQLAELSVGDKTIEQLRLELVAKIGENVQIRRLQRMKSAPQGKVISYRHGTRIGVLVSIVGGSEELGKDIAMHIAASNPQAIRPEDVSAAVIEKEREIFSAQAQSSGKPAEIVAKMVEGRIKKFLEEVSLLAQPFVKDSSQTVGQLLTAHKAQVVDFVRYELGEGIEKQVEDFAKEVMAQVKGER